MTKRSSFPMAIRLLVPLFFIALLSTKVTHAQDQARCAEHEKDLLLEFRNELVFNSSKMLLRWNNETDDCCRWDGVECEGGGHVITLDLSYESISGGFNESSSLFRLKYLEKLELAYTLLSGSLPESISKLERLTYMDLSHNKFSGPIPSTLSNLTHLTDLALADNLFTGSISSIHFEALSNVSWLDLSQNSLSGPIPVSIFAMPSLTKLILSDNQLSWQVSEFPILNISTQLYYLDLSSNRLESPIPSSFFSLHTLEILSLSHNLFNHTFQLEKILSLPKLSHLDLSSNSLSLDDATSIHSSSRKSLVRRSILDHLDLSNNKIAGEIPSWVWEIGDGSLTYLNLSCNMLVDLQKPYKFPSPFYLEFLDLHSNQLRGEMLLPPKRALYVDYSNNYFEITENTGNFSSFKLRLLSLSNNSLSGPLPTFICNCTHLEVLDLSVNSLSGSIPPCLFDENFKDLKVLNLGRNSISGRIPREISPNCSLRTLDLSHNDLVGEVPLSLDKCSSLEVMNVRNNHMEDSFPCMLPSSLLVLVLRSNRFHGGIICQNKSWENLRIIDIASNNFSGYLNPFNFSTWKGMMFGNNTSLEHVNLGVEALWNNYYTDEVTLTIKGLELKLVKIRPEFTSIDFSCNNFNGDIPREIGELHSLYLLNLSHNSLTGEIPKSLGELRQLGSLDLSVNQLTGEIPKEIAGLTFLQGMNVSHNNLVGKIPVGSQIQTFSAGSFEGNTRLCGLPLKISCTDTRSPPLPNTEAEREIKWEYVFSAAGYAVGLGSFLWVLLFCRSFRYNYFDKIEDVFDKIVYRYQRKKRRGRGTRVGKNQVTRQ